MTLSPLEERILALAGVLQASLLIYEWVIEDKSDELAFNTCISSLYQQNPAQFIEIYGDVKNLRRGLILLSKIFDAPKASVYREVTRYAIGALHLAKQLQKNSKLSDSLSQRIRFAGSQAEYFNATHSNVIASLAQAYTETLGTLNFRIHIVGRPELMKRSDAMSKSRALLLAAVRSAILWYQLGGRHWQLLFKRKQMQEGARALLARIPE